MIILSLIAYHLSFLPTAIATSLACYTPEGDSRNAQFNESDGYLYQPCNSTGKPFCILSKRIANTRRSKFFNVLCDRAGTDSLGQSRHTCLANGLCQSSTGAIWRESCTDPTWQDPACIKLFVNNTGYDGGEISYDENGKPLTDVTVTLCDNKSLCYGEDNRECCMQGQGVFIDTGTGEQNQTNPVVAPSSTGGIASSDASHASDLSAGAVAGVGIATGLGAVSIMCVIIFWWRKCKRSTSADVIMIEPTRDVKHPDSAILELPPTYRRGAKDSISNSNDSLLLPPAELSNLSNKPPAELSS